MTAPPHRSNSDLLDELREDLQERPRRRMHVHPHSVFWITVSVQNTGLSPHVRVVADPECEDRGKGWIETLSAARWRELRALLGHRVSVRTADLGTLTGTLLALNDGEAQVDVGDGDVRYLPWITLHSSEEGS